MSAQANLAGLFMPTTEEKWSDDILWQPIPVHTVPKELDYVLYAERECPKYDKDFDKYMDKSEEVERIYRQYDDLFAYWTEKSGKKIKSIKKVHALHKTLFTEKIQNKK